MFLLFFVLFFKKIFSISFNFTLNYNNEQCFNEFLLEDVYFFIKFDFDSENIIVNVKNNENKNIFVSSKGLNNIFYFTTFNEGFYEICIKNYDNNKKFVNVYLQFEKGLNSKEISNLALNKEINENFDTLEQSNNKLLNEIKKNNELENNNIIKIEKIQKKIQTSFLIMLILMSLITFFYMILFKFYLKKKKKI
jgi:hypothetical protein